MTEIKFRAWDKTGKSVKQMNYGLNLFNTSIFNKHIHNSVGPEDLIIMQFTGLKDKNEKDIYEGDILRVCNNKNGGLVVEFVNAYVGGWVLTHPTSDMPLSLGARKKQDIEIIGNIHENKDLLK